MHRDLFDRLLEADSVFLFDMSRDIRFRNTVVLERQPEPDRIALLQTVIEHLTKDLQPAAEIPAFFQPLCTDIRKLLDADGFAVRRDLLRQLKAIRIVFFFDMAAFSMVIREINALKGVNLDDRFLRRRFRGFRTGFDLKFLLCARFDILNAA